MRGERHRPEAPQDEGEVRATTGAGTDKAAFPVGVLAGAAVGGVGGALVGNETAAATDASRPRDPAEGVDPAAKHGAP